MLTSISIANNMPQHPSNDPVRFVRMGWVHSQVVHDSRRTLGVGVDETNLFVHDGSRNLRCCYCALSCTSILSQSGKDPSTAFDGLRLS